jgi:hypothetical protein
LEGLKKTTKSLGQGDLAEIRTNNFPNKGLYACDVWQLCNKACYVTVCCTHILYCHKTILLLILYIYSNWNHFLEIRSIYPSHCLECLQVKQNEIFSRKFLISVTREVKQVQIRRVRLMSLIWYLFLAKSRLTKYDLREWLFLFVWCKTHFSITNVSLLKEFQIVNVTGECLVDCLFWRHSFVIDNYFTIQNQIIMILLSILTFLLSFSESLKFFHRKFRYFVSGSWDNISSRHYLFFRMPDSSKNIVQSRRKYPSSSYFQ